MNREAFLKGLSLPERDVELSAGVVVVRALARGEVVALASLKDDLAMLEQKILQLGFVEPALTAEDVVLWYANAPSGDVDLAVTAISELSGMAPGSSKSGVHGVPRGRRP